MTSLSRSRLRRNFPTKRTGGQGALPPAAFRPDACVVEGRTFPPWCAAGVAPDSSFAGTCLFIVGSAALDAVFERVAWGVVEQEQQMVVKTAHCLFDTSVSTVAFCCSAKRQAKLGRARVTRITNNSIQVPGHTMAESGDFRLAVLLSSELRFG